MDYYPSATMVHGPIWKNPLELLPVARVLEENYPLIRAELESILAAGTTFEDLDSTTRNAETQFGPRGDDWLTAYLFRKGEAIPEVCAYAPKTCEILKNQPEIGNCKQGGSGAGFLRMRPGGRLKPHFGNAPRHLFDSSRLHFLQGLFLHRSSSNILNAIKPHPKITVSVCWV